MLELGAGTGEIGAALAAASAAGYVGLDLSLAMLGRFRARRGATGEVPPALLLRADADRPWPLPAASVRLLFASRAAHLLDAEHLAAESRRVALPAGALFVLGRTQREPGSLRRAMRREMRRLLAEHGVEGRSGEVARDRLFASFERRGGRLLPPETVASWPVVERPADSLAAWRAKPWLAGTPLSTALRDEVLAQLEAWARRTWGDLESRREATESYELAALRLTPTTEENA